MSKKLPNIIFVLADDLGWGDLGCYGHDVTSPDLADLEINRVKTPNIDKMAKEGKLFNRYYVNSPMCSPARAGMMTGIHPAKHGIHCWQNGAGAKHNQHFGLADYVDPKLPNLANTLKRGWI